MANLETGQRWIVGLLFTLLIANVGAAITIVRMPPDLWERVRKIQREIDPVILMCTHLCKKLFAQIEKLHTLKFVALLFESKLPLHTTGEKPMQIPTPQDKFAEFDARLSRIEGIVEQIDKRLSSLETRMANLETGQRWIVGLLFTLLIANVGAAITIVLTLSK